jgi:hypothetical protein
MDRKKSKEGKLLLERIKIREIQLAKLKAKHAKIRKDLKKN